MDRLMAALFREQPETATPATTPTQSVARSVHDARRMRKAGDLDGALAVLGGADTANAAETKEARWAYAEWMALAKRRFGDRELLVYSQGAGRAAALTFPATTARWKWSPLWGCAGRRARSSRGAACGG